MKIVQVTLTLGYPDQMDQSAVRVALAQAADAFEKDTTFIGAEVLTVTVAEEP